MRKWIPRFSEIAKPLHRLTAKGVRFNWNSDCREAFERLKTEVANSTNLCVPDTEDPFKSYIVTIDASKHGYGATLSQEIVRDGKRERRIVAFFSKSVPPFKREQSQTRLEFDSMILALRQWKIYLRNTTFKVVTDCKSLLAAGDRLFSKSDPALIRKCQELQDYDFVLEHIEGAKNDLCDFLSRFPFNRKGKDQATQVGTSDVVSNGRAPSVFLKKADTIAPIEKAEFPSVVNTIDESPSDSKNVVTSAPCVSVSKSVKFNLAPLVEPFASDIFNIDLTPCVDSNSDTSQDLIPNIGTSSSEDYCVCSVPEYAEFRDQHSPIDSVAAISEQGMQNLPTIKRERLIEEQKADPILKEVRRWVENKDREKIQVNRVPDLLMSYWKQFSLLTIENDLLKRKWVRKKEDDSLQLIVVPETCWESVISKLHDSDESCHAGIEICLARCRQLFYWPGMQEEFTMYINGCIRCGEIKQPRRFLKAPLQHLYFHNMNDAVTVDHIVPSAEQRTPRGFRYILTITDAWSNYLVAIPVRTQTAKENVAAIMKHWVCRFGMFREIIVDNHPGFTADFFHGVFSAFECKTTHGTSYKAASTARAENSNKRVNKALRAILPVGKEHNWDIFLDKVVFALNCMKNSRTGYSGNRLVYGREANVPLNILVDDNKEFQPTTVNKATQEAYDLHKCR